MAYCNRVNRLTFQGLVGRLCPYTNALSGRSKSSQSREQLDWLFTRRVVVNNLTLCVGENDTDAAMKCYLELSGGGAFLQSIELIQRHDRTNFSLLRTASIISKYSVCLKDISCSYLMNMSGKVLLVFADGCPSKPPPRLLRLRRRGRHSCRLVTCNSAILAQYTGLSECESHIMH